MTATEYADAALAEMQGGGLLTVSPERSRNVLVAAFRRAMLEERRECATAALLAIHSGGRGRDIGDAIKGRALP